MLKKVLIFLLFNFGAIAIGSLYTTQGVSSDWYQQSNQAPWTPPGWVFGAAWTTIMICFSFFMAFAWDRATNKKLLIGLFVVQWFLNVGWNPIFFGLQEVLFGLIVISALTILIGYMTYRYGLKLKLRGLLILPYLVWLIIATSLNAYILLMN